LCASARPLAVVQQGDDPFGLLGAYVEMTPPGPAFISIASGFQSWWKSGTRRVSFPSRLAPFSKQCAILKGKSAGLYDVPIMPRGRKIRELTKEVKLSPE